MQYEDVSVYIDSRLFDFSLHFNQQPLLRTESAEVKRHIHV